MSRKKIDYKKRSASCATWCRAFCFATLVIVAPTHAQENPPLEYSSLAPLASHSLLTAVAGNGDFLVAVGDRGHVLLSNSAAKDWQQIVVPTRALFTAVTMPNEHTIIAVGHDQTIIQSTDLGKTWSKNHEDLQVDAPLLDVVFTDNTHGFAVGAYGSLLSTIDGGKNWQATSLNEEDRHLYSIAATADGKELYIAGESGLLYGSQNSGESWEALPSPYAGSFFSVTTLSDQSVLIAGLRGHLFRSQDKGHTWQSIATNTTASLLSVRQIDPTKVVVVGMSGSLLVSTDLGNTFQSFPRADRKAITSTIGLKSSEILLVGENGILPSFSLPTTP